MSGTDKSIDSGFVAWYRNKGSKKPEDTLRFFNRKDYHTAHGADALWVAREVYHTLSAVKYYGSKGASEDEKDGLPGVSISPALFETVLRELLLVRQLRVEEWHQSGGTWRLARSASPGNLQAFEDVLFRHEAMEDAPRMMAACTGTDAHGAHVVGLAYVDATLRQIGVTQFADSELYCNLESMVVQLGAKECILAEAVASNPEGKLAGVFARACVPVTSCKAKVFDARDVEQDMRRLLRQGNQVLALLDQHCAMRSVAALIKSLDLLADDTSFGQYRIVPIDLSMYMRLDTTAVRALDLLPTPGDATKFSLFTLLNRCRSAMGSRSLMQWIKQPLVDVDALTQRQDTVELLVENTTLRQLLYDQHMRRVPDVERLAKKFQRGRASLSDVVRVYQLAKMLPALLADLGEADSSGEEGSALRQQFVKPLEKAVGETQGLIELVDTALDASTLDSHDVMIDASFDDALREVRADLDEARAQMHAAVPRIAADLGLDEKVLKLDHTSQLGHYLRVSRKFAPALDKAKKRYHVYEARKDGSKFVNDDLRSLSARHASLMARYNETQRALVEKVVGIAASYVGVLEELGVLLATLDVLLAFAVAAATAPQAYVRPVLTAAGTGDTVLIGARHPCIEAQDGISFIPNDIRLVRGTGSFHIITGPNMGGKSTYIRQAGLIVLMAQLGCFVPCTSASVSITDCILARVGAGDSQLRGVSTFMAEMLETAAILRTATERSLIIIDELGRGTSTYDGFGLAWAISRHIIDNTRCFGMFATHFHELTALADSCPCVRNLHVTALTDNGTLTLLYKVRDGASDQSFGIHVAELAKFPAEVIASAKRKAAELEDFDSKHEQTREAKRARLQPAQQAAAEQMHAVLRDFVNAPVNTMSGDEAVATAQNLLKTLQASDNPIVQAALQAGS